jgi:hypothetical protein
MSVIAALIKEWGPLLGGLGTAWWAIHGFSVGQRWKKMEFTQGVIQRFNGLPMVSFCQQMLDHPCAPLFVDGTAIHLTDGMLASDGWLKKEDGGYVFDHHWDNLPKLLAPSYIRPGHITASEFLICSAFQVMFDELEQIMLHKEARLLDRKLADAALDYWLQMVREVECSLNGPTPFTTYMRNYGYDDLLRVYRAVDKRKLGVRGHNWHKDCGLSEDQSAEGAAGAGLV